MLILNLIKDLYHMNLKNDMRVIIKFLFF